MGSKLSPPKALTATLSDPYGPAGVVGGTVVAVGLPVVVEVVADVVGVDTLVGADVLVTTEVLVEVTDVFEQPEISRPMARTTVMIMQGFRCFLMSSPPRML